MKTTTGTHGRARARRSTVRGALAVAVAVASAMIAAACSSGTTTTADGPPESVTTTRPAPSRPARTTQVATPTVSGPITGGTYGKPFNPITSADATTYGYTETEYFVEGNATSYTPDGTWGEDGVWAVKPAPATGAYKTRIVVRLPTDKAKFNGTVMVEWLNVTSGMDADPDFGFTHDELLRKGYGSMAVSAQKVGIEGGGARIPIPGFEVKALKQWDAQRYGPLVHPGDEFSYDIFSQAAGTTLARNGVNPFDGYDVQYVLATGESQSAARMVTYVNAIQPVVSLFDGFMIHSRGGGGAQLGPATSGPAVSHIRSDLQVPVLQFQTETDLFGLGFATARQPDTDKLRTWEVAGTAHADQFTLDYGIESGHEWDPTASIDFTAMCGVINTGPQTYVERAALAALRAWVVDGTQPPKGTPIEDIDGKVARETNGNAKGGIRTAAVDVPISTLSGEPGGASSMICSLFGTTTAFTPELLASLYPNRDAYVTGVEAATKKAVAAGFVLAADEAEIIAAAKEATIPG